LWRRRLAGGFAMRDVNGGKTPAGRRRHKTAGSLCRRMNGNTALLFGQAEQDIEFRP
jgi:hypothetical protein